MGYKATLCITLSKELNMTRTEFYIKACIAFANNGAIVKENFSTDYCVNLITNLAEKLTDKVAESADFDPEYQLP